jgi:hypothetical protein
MTHTETEAEAILAQVSREDRIEAGQREHIRVAGRNSADHGFHDDWPYTPTEHELSIMTDEELAEYKLRARQAIVEKLALIHEEISEALGEIRSGKDPLHIYFSRTEKVKGDDGKVYREIVTYYDEQAYGIDGKPLYKPEGFLVELADANIRISDLVFLVEGADEYVEADRVKREYNASREYKHGRKF